MQKFASEEVAAAARNSIATAALAARARLDDAFAAQDVARVAELSSKDLIVNSPRNAVFKREQVLELFKAGRMNYESADETIEALAATENQVVLMGEEVIRPQASAPNAGKTVRRRFTDLWRREADGQWRLAARQATITSIT
jgi:ketosteroid isomerase-like protein